jgi:hypothetical protein
LARTSIHTFLACGRHENRGLSCRIAAADERYFLPLAHARLDR